MELFIGLMLLMMLGLFAFGVISSIILWIAIFVLSVLVAIIGFFIKILPWLIVIFIGWWVLVRIRSPGRWDHR